MITSPTVHIVCLNMIYCTSIIHQFASISEMENAAREQQISRYSTRTGWLRGSETSKTTSGWNWQFKTRRGQCWPNLGSPNAVTSILVLPISIDCTFEKGIREYDIRIFLRLFLDPRKLSLNATNSTINILIIEGIFYWLISILKYLTSTWIKKKKGQFKHMF